MQQGEYDVTIAGSQMVHFCTSLFMVQCIWRINCALKDSAKREQAHHLRHIAHMSSEGATSSQRSQTELVTVPELPLSSILLIKNMFGCCYRVGKGYVDLHSRPPD